MTYNPPTLVALGDFWNDQGGVNLGVVGDTAHAAKGYSYHLGADQLTADAYSRRTARDRAGLTNAASAIDLGKLGGALIQLREFSGWLVAQGRANAAGTSDIREVIYTADGKTVLRWDRERGYASAPRAGEADNSHLTHTHVSFYRDAEARDHRTAFRPYFAGGTDVRFANSNGYAVTSLKRLALPAGQLWTYLDGSPGGSFSRAATVDCLGLADSKAGAYIVEIGTGGPYVDKITRSTLVMVKTSALPTDVPAPAPVDCTQLVADAKAAEHERVRAAAIAAVGAI